MKRFNAVGSVRAGLVVIGLCGNLGAAFGQDEPQGDLFEDAPGGASKSSTRENTPSHRRLTPELEERYRESLPGRAVPTLPPLPPGVDQFFEPRYQGGGPPAPIPGDEEARIYVGAPSATIPPTAEPPRFQLVPDGDVFRTLTAQEQEWLRLMPRLKLAPPYGTGVPERQPRPEPKPKPGGGLTEAEEAMLPRFESIKPLPLAPIPYDPPPHEGAMIDLPLTVEPPDLLDVEVLEGLPGRPITGERMVRPDGTIALGFYGDIHVRGLTAPQIKTKIILHLRRYLTDEVLGLTGLTFNGERLYIPPEDSDRVFVDIAAYNSDYYYMQGNLTSPGRLPWTGNETVLEGVNYAGGLAPIGNPLDIRLMRPARGDQPRRTFKIDLKAIEEGDCTANLQIFPGDRIIVGRLPVVQATIEIDRISAPIHTMTSLTLQVSYMIQHLGTALDSVDATPEQRRDVVKRLVNIWTRTLARPEDAPFGEAEIQTDVKKIMDLVVPGKRAKVEGGAKP